jgi:FkbM family methyltransferase
MSLIQSARAILPKSAKVMLHAGRMAYRSALLSSARRSAASSFSGEVIAAILDLRSARIENPVRDLARFPQPQESFDPATALKLISFVRSRATEFDELGTVLNDVESKELLKALFAYRALGPTRVALPRANAYPSKLDAEKLLVQRKSEHEFPPFTLGIYEVPVSGGTISIEAWPVNVIYTFVERQYFYNRNGVYIAPEPGDIVIDGGACFGDTALLFSDVVGPTGRVHSFEPLPRQLEVFNRNLRRNPELASRISVHPYALDEMSRQLTFADKGAAARASSDGTVLVQATSIDDFVAKESVPRVDFIKMDIEGAETAGLMGAAHTIRRFRPRLAISVYHSWSDLITLPILVKRLFPDYELFLDHHTIHTEETILYARPA